MTSSHTSSWSLFEISEVSENNLSQNNSEMLQLYHYKGHNQEDKDNNLWIICSTGKGAYADSFLCNLVQKSLMKNAFRPEADVYLTPLINVKMNKLFNTAPSNNSCASQDKIADTLLKWKKVVQPRCIISISLGSPKVRYKDVADHVLEKIQELAERPQFELGKEQLEEADHSANATGACPSDLEKHFSHWLKDGECSFIDFTMDISKRSFEEVSQSEWKSYVGPSLKWLIEGLRFVPPKEDPINTIEIIPPLDIPAEFLA